MKFSKDTQAKINEVLAIKEKAMARMTNVETHNAAVAKELIEARQSLEAAVHTFANEPSEANREAEKQARIKVAELEVEVNGAQERLGAVNSSDQHKIVDLQNEAIQLAKNELRANYDKKKPIALQKIEDAKKAYLLALKELYDLTMVETQGKYYEVVSELGVDENTARMNEPGVSMHKPLLTYRDPGYNYYGISGLEMDKAFAFGVIEKGSIRE